jgi:hypothetical protein
LGARDTIEDALNVLSAIPVYEESGSAELAQNDDTVATQSQEVDRPIVNDRIKVVYRLEVGAARAVRAQSLWNGVDAFRAVPIVKLEGTISNVAIAVDCIDPRAVLVGYQNLAAKWPEE